MLGVPARGRGEWKAKGEPSLSRVRSGVGSRWRLRGRSWILVVVVVAWRRIDAVVREIGGALVPLVVLGNFIFKPPRFKSLSLRTDVLSM